jgi:hypothetical protein
VRRSNGDGRIGDNVDWCCVSGEERRTGSVVVIVVTGLTGSTAGWIIVAAGTKGGTTVGARMGGGFETLITAKGSLTTASFSYRQLSEVSSAVMMCTSPLMTDGTWNRRRGTNIEKTKLLEVMLGLNINICGMTEYIKSAEDG